MCDIVIVQSDDKGCHQRAQWSMDTQYVTQNPTPISKLPSDMMSFVFYVFLFLFGCKLESYKFTTQQHGSEPLMMTRVI